MANKICIISPNLNSYLGYYRYVDAYFDNYLMRMETRRSSYPRQLRLLHDDEQAVAIMSG